MKSFLFLESAINPPINWLKNEFSVKSVVELSQLWDNSFKDTFALFTKLRYTINPDDLRSMPNLRFILSPTTSVDHLPLDYCISENIKIINLEPSDVFEIKSTSEVALLHILNLTRNFVDYAFSVRSGSWNRNLFTNFSLRSLDVGILGYGRIGRQVAESLKILGAKVKVFDVNSNLYESSSGINFVSSKQELFSNCNIVSVHVSGIKENTDLIDGSCFDNVTKKPFWLVNTSRGFVVDEEALLQAILSGIVTGYGGDVLTNENGRTSDWLKVNPIQKLSTDVNFQIHITPHIGGATVDSIEFSEEIVFEKFRAFCSQQNNQT